MTALTPNPSPAERSRRAGRRIVVFAALAALLAALALLRLGIGSTGVRLPSPEDPVFWLRLHRLGAAAVVGVALAISGVSLQALLRNPLAEPFILGLSTGAGVGLMLQRVLEQDGRLHLGSHYTGALLGASATMLIVFAAARRRGTLDPLGLLLVGVVLSTINGALIMLLNYLYGRGMLHTELARWMMGFISENVAGSAVSGVAGLTAAGLAILWVSGRAMDVATFSEAEAQSLGVNLRALRTLLFVVASVLTAASVVLAGPIAFVGLICPHLARALLGPAHRPVLVAAALLGASLIVAADTTSAMLDLRANIGLVPIGIFTAMIGGPAFLWMLRPQLGRGVE